MAKEKKGVAPKIIIKDKGADQDQMELLQRNKKDQRHGWTMRKKVKWQRLQEKKSFVIIWLYIYIYIYIYA